MALEDDKNERRVLVAIALGLALVAAKVHRAHVPPPRSSTVVSVPSPIAEARTSIVIAPGSVVLGGAVSSESERKTLVAMTKSTFPTFDVVDSLSVSPGESSQALRDVVAECAPIRWGDVSFARGETIVRGDVGPSVDRAALVSAIERAAGGTARVSLSLRAAPSVEPHVLEAEIASRFAGPLVFAFQGSELDSNANATIDALVPSLAHLDGLEVVVQPIPSPAEPAEKWTDLALARGEAVKRRLEARGVPLGHLRVTAAHVPPAAPEKPIARVRIDTRFFVREVRAVK